MKCRKKKTLSASAEELCVYLCSDTFIQGLAIGCSACPSGDEPQSEHDDDWLTAIKKKKEMFLFLFMYF